METLSTKALAYKVLERNRKGNPLETESFPTRKPEGSKVSIGNRVETGVDQSAGHEVLAVKIRSEFLAEDIWLLFGDTRMDDGLVAYYPEEIEYLKRLPHEEIKRIHRTKKIFPNSKIVS